MRCWFIQAALMLSASADMARASDLFASPEADAKVKEIRTWLGTKGVRDFEPVSLFCDQLDKVNTLLPFPL